MRAKDLRYLGREDCSGPGLAKCVRCAAAHYGALRGVPTAIAQRAGAPLLRRRTSRFIAVSATVRDRNGLPSDTTAVIPNFLPDDDPPVDERDRDLVAQLPAAPFVLFVGALGSHKGFDVLLDAWRRLAGDAGIGGGLRLVAIGHRWVDTPADMPPGVLVLEDWPNGAVRAAWERCLVGVIPSVWAEPFGIVALEAMAAGRAVVASATGGLADIVRDGVTGLVVPPGDVTALADALGRLIKEPALRERLGDGARERVAQYRASTVVPRIVSVYHIAVEEHHRGRRVPGAAA